MRNNILDGSNNYTNEQLQNMYNELLEENKRLRNTIFELNDELKAVYNELAYYKNQFVDPFERSE